MKRIKLFFAIMSTMLVMNSQMFAQDTYFQFGGLNQSSVNVGSSWTKLGTGTHSFTKSQNDTDIEVYVNSRFSIGSHNAGGVRFQVRIDDVDTPNYDNQGSILAPTILEFLSIFAVFQNISAGSHTISIWAIAPSGSADNVGVDPGGWSGKMIVKVPNDAVTSISSENPAVPDDFILKQNYPNPFNPETTIEYVVQQSSEVELKIYNNLGQLVKTLLDDYKTTGEYSVVWDGKDNSGKAVTSGNYFYQFKMGEFASTKKMIYIK